ncbi:GDSL family lipase [Adhaeribacter swui]|uniref:GDSL family lipase n=1 Tax=Adhaeribacter swui TaxID=2086471 RepID=A0A7G7GEE4_9BACT|nr:SGNH/GDSL hydrolase family protein [Adhaeribacter swui]QNF35528.1 GDSL family lipase [Adhaeribacter swui]
MLLKYFRLAVLFLFLCASCASPKVKSETSNSLLATDLKPFGRYLINPSQHLELISSAAHFGFSFEGPGCAIFASIPNAEGHDYLQYELDGVYQKRIKVKGNAKEPLIISSPGPGKHTLWIYKATEAHTGPIVIRSINGTNLKPLARPTAPIIEFIGNSITCGAAADPSEVPCGTGAYHDQHNAYQAYGPRVARALNVNFVLSSVSGIGVYRNWNSDGPTMPQVYEKTDFQANSSQLWNFKTYSPKVVSIALGTNDFSKGDGKKARLPFDSANFVNTYVQFVQVVKSKYPGSQIALLSSPMINGANRTLLQNCLTSVKTQIDALNPTAKPVELFFFQPMQARGCAGHPNVEDHAMLAQELEPFFNKLLQ